MNQRKQNQHDAIHARLGRALAELYHNATVTYPRDVPDNRLDLFESWFADSALDEIAYIGDGGAYARNDSKWKKILESNAQKFTSEAARKYYVRKGMREMHHERSRCNRLDSRHNAVNAQWERIGEFGTLYSWGRGGRTLAPDGLVSQRGGGSFSIRGDAFESSNIADCVDAILILESFNRYVESWCKNIPALWREYFADTLWSERLERKRDRAKAKEIARNKRNARETFANIAQF